MGLKVGRVSNSFNFAAGMDTAAPHGQRSFLPSLPIGARSDREQLEHFTEIPGLAACEAVVFGEAPDAD